jgi:hypothetical protein
MEISPGCASASAEVGNYYTGPPVAVSTAIAVRRVPCGSLPRPGRRGWGVRSGQDQASAHARPEEMTCAILLVLAHSCGYRPLSRPGAAGHVSLKGKAGGGTRQPTIEQRGRCRFAMLGDEAAISGVDALTLRHSGLDRSTAFFATITDPVGPEFMAPAQLAAWVMGWAARRVDPLAYAAGVGSHPGCRP